MPPKTKKPKRKVTKRTTTTFQDCKMKWQVMEDIRRKEKVRMRKQKSRALKAQVLVDQVKKKKK